MNGFVVSKGGTFGTIAREYVDGAGTAYVVIRWGPSPPGRFTPVRAADCRQLISSSESEAKDEAIKWLKEQQPARYAPIIRKLEKP